MPALGFGLGMERLLLLLKQQSVELPGADPCEIFIASLGQSAKLAAFRLCDTLWKSSVQAACDVNARGLKAQMKYADKIGAKYCLVLGDDELAAGKAELKNMKTGEKKKISLGYKTEATNPWTIFNNEYKVGDVVTVKIVKLMTFGAFAEIIPGVDGLIHISQIADRRIGKPEDVLSEGQEVDAKIIDIDQEHKRISLSIRALLAPAADEAEDAE